MTLCEQENANSAIFLEAVQNNPVNRALLKRLPEMGLEQCLLTAGCLFQTFWNERSGQSPTHGIKDYDVFYYDDRDLSWQAEDSVIKRGKALFQDLGVEVEFKNQARVHLWYPQRFNVPYPALTSTREGIDRYLITATCVGIDTATLALYTPYGLTDCFNGVLRRNPKNDQPVLFAEKARAYQTRWPWLRLEP